MDNETRKIFAENALRMMKYRKDRMQEDTSRDEYYRKRIEEAICMLEGRGIVLMDTPDDLMLVVDVAADYDANRDKQTGEPEWLKMKIMRRWMAQ